MSDELISFDLPEKNPAAIKVLGIGGGGTNAVNYMYRQGIYNVHYIVCNTDMQSLGLSPVKTKIQIGRECLKGLGAGKNPEEGRKAAIEDLDEIMKTIGTNTNMIFLTAGMGGGTGTGAAPVIAKATKEAGILTVGIVTMPFEFEGPQRMKKAVEGLNELSNNVDALLVIHNEKLREIYGDQGYSNSFAKADNILATAAKGIAEIITIPSTMNVDFNDVKNVLKESGIAHMSSSFAEGENRAVQVIEDALNSPLLNNNSISGAKSILLNIISGQEEITIDEITCITKRLNLEMDRNANFIWGISQDEKLGNKIGITLIAAGFEKSVIPELYISETDQKVVAKTNASDYLRPRKTEPLILNTILPDTNSLINNNPLPAIDPQKAVERINTLKEIHSTVKPQKINHNNLRQSLDELEKIPAYIRRNKKNDTSSENTKPFVSKYSLFDNDTEGVQLRPDNPFIDPKVD